MPLCTSQHQYGQSHAWAMWTMQLYNSIAQQQQCKQSGSEEREKRKAKVATDNLQRHLLPKLQKLMEVAKSNWEPWCSIHRRALCNPICLRYGWQPPLLPIICGCGNLFTIDHAHNCPTEGFPDHAYIAMRFKISRWIWCQEVCHDVWWDLTSNPSQVSTCHLPTEKTRPTRCESKDSKDYNSRVHLDRPYTLGTYRGSEGDHWALIYNTGWLWTLQGFGTCGVVGTSTTPHTQLPVSYYSSRLCTWTLCDQCTCSLGFLISIYYRIMINSI